LICSDEGLKRAKLLFLGYVEPKEKASLVVDVELNPCPKRGEFARKFALEAS